MQFRGSDKSSKIDIFKQIKLRYCPLFLVPTIVGIITYIAGLFLIVCMQGIIMGLFQIPNRPEGNDQMMIVVVSFLGEAVIAVLVMTKLYNRIFHKEVSLIEINQKEFQLIINNRCYSYAKKDIVAVKLIRNFGRARMMSEGRIVIKMSDRTFRFSAEKNNFAYVDSLFTHLNQWKML